MNVLPGLTVLNFKHSKHHGHTHIILKKLAQKVVENKYPIVDTEQNESSFFPWYSFFGFVGFVTPIFGLTQWLLAKTPIFLGGFLALAWSLFLYEVIHAIEHWPLEKWLPLLEHPKLGFIWKRAYGFHLRHHADIRSNESVSGFFSLPLWDWVFGTLVFPKTLYENGKYLDEEEFSSPTPILLIRKLDEIAIKYSWRKSQRKVKYAR